MTALIWFAVALLLLALEWLGAEFDGLLVGAVAALLVSLATALLPLLSTAAQLLLFAAATGALLLALQRWSRRRERSIPQSDASEQATVISGFGGSMETGRVRWQGQSWAAANLSPEQTLLPGEAVLVMGRNGNQLQVMRQNPERSGPER